MTAITSEARGKVNLTLRVLGRRTDGYHDLDSIVAFADVCDVVWLQPGKPMGVSVMGPFAAAIAGPNLAERAVLAAVEACPDLAIGHFGIEKLLPVAAGIGGGSADAAAVLRLIRNSNPKLAPEIDWLAMAESLGSDVPVCFLNTPCHMSGRGEILRPLHAFPALSAVLVNPQVPVPADKTRQVFQRLAAPHLPAASTAAAMPMAAGPGAWLDLIVAAGNDLEAPAVSVVPDIADVLTALRAHGLTRLARLSGAGPTCFALTETAADAAALAATIAETHPTWWVRATQLH